MLVHDTLFWFFSLAMLLSGVLVITNRNPVNSAMFLILLFFFMAGLFVLLEAFDADDLQVAGSIARERQGRDEQVLMGLNCRDLETLGIECPRAPIGLIDGLEGRGR